MMKKCMLVLLVILLLVAILLCSAAYATETAEPCPHEYEKRSFLINENRRYIQENYPDDSAAFYGYALCQLCSYMPLLVVDPNMLEAKPCEQDECIHRLYVLPDSDYFVWKEVKDENGHTYDELRKYEASVCIDCNLVVMLFETWESAEHQMVEKQGFHIDGQYIHVIWEECLLCGMIDGDLVPCVSYADGSCDRTK